MWAGWGSGAGWEHSTPRPDPVW